MVSGDATFVPYKDPRSPSTVKSPAAGRIFVVKFLSSSERHLFWLQSAPAAGGAADTFSARDLRMGSIVDRLWAGDDVDVEAEMRDAADDEPARDGDGDGDDDMRDPDADVNGEGGGGLSSSTGGAGADATGGDVREEGEEAREGGADGARA
jgi:26S proteasome regulatory subunit N13